ncbi:MAG TPA: metallopeptidase TldD-related protein, partial [Savagea sp.]
RTYPVILQNDAASSFLSVFLSSFSAEQVEKGQSRLVNQLNEQIASSVLTIIDDPHDANAYHRTNFDAEGVATQQQTIIKDGCLKTYLHSRKSAKRFGVEPTGHAAQYSYKGSIVIAPHQFVVAAGEATKEELINDLQNGVLITNLNGLHAGANEVSGDFSLAANGLYIEQGQIKHAIKQMTIAGNFFDLLQEIHRVGNDCYYGFSRVSSPSLVFSALPITVEE